MDCLPAICTAVYGSDSDTSTRQALIASGTPAVATGVVDGHFGPLLDLTTDELVRFVETGRPHPRRATARQTAGGR